MGEFESSIKINLFINSILYLKGTLSSGGSQPNVLYNVQLDCYPSSYCGNVPGTKNWESQICAGNLLLAFS